MKKKVHVWTHAHEQLNRDQEIWEKNSSNWFSPTTTPSCWVKTELIKSASIFVDSSDAWISMYSFRLWMVPSAHTHTKISNFLIMIAFQSNYEQFILRNRIALCTLRECHCIKPATTFSCEFGCWAVSC